MSWWWGAILFLIGTGVGALLMAVAAAAVEDTWRTAYLNARDRLWELQRDSEGA